jgi:hypothetical protein
MLDPDSQQAKDLRRIYIDQTLGVDKQPPAPQPWGLWKILVFCAKATIILSIVGFCLTLYHQMQAPPTKPAAPDAASKGVWNF